MRFAALVVGAAGVLSGCVGASRSIDDTRCPEGRRSELTVLSASSMARALEEIEAEFLVADPCVSDVLFSFGSSATLAAQAANGAPADVFVSASRSTMATVVAAGRIVGEPRVFARNVAAILVSNGAPEALSIEAVDDLVDAPGRDVLVGLCAVTAPCGALADDVLERAGLDRGAVVDTETTSVEDLVTKIDLGELDAGIVYGSDCTGARTTVRCVEIAGEVNSTTEYAVAALSDSESARRWLEFMTSEQILRALVDTHGFLAP